MVTDNQGGERSQFINELISLEEALERLEGAKLVTENQRTKIDQLYRRISQLNRGVEKLNRILEDITIQQRDIARDLAHTAGQTHKDKDEALLAAIYRLLSIGYAPVKIIDMDDIASEDDELPF